MTKRYAVLQKKLQELESQLSDVFSLPAETPCHQLVSEGIEHRFVFLKSLLTAEIASHPSKPQHLHYIADRLTELETTFRERDKFRNSAADNLETGSICSSCTVSCLKDDGEALPEKFYNDLGFTVDDVPGEFIEVKTPCHQLVSEGIKLGFVFLRNLLIAEIASHPSKPQHLHHIADRLTELERAFREWNEYRNSAADNLETGSIGSCTMSCINDDGEALTKNFNSSGFTINDVQGDFTEAVIYKERRSEETVEKIETGEDLKGMEGRGG